MWMHRNMQRFASFGRVLIVEAADEYGFPYLADELRTTQSHVLWLSLAPEDAGSVVRQGDKLADAASRAFKSPLFGKGMPYSYGLAILQKHLDILSPITVVLSNAEYGVSLASGLAALSNEQSRIILQFHRIPSHYQVPSNALLINRADLRLQQDEAKQLVRERVSLPVVQDLLTESRGAYEVFLSLLNQRLQLPERARPSPNGDIRLSEIPRADIDGLLGALRADSKWMEAFEVAARELPERVPEIIDPAGEAFFTKGAFEQFWRLLQLLPERIIVSERVAYWHYAAALATNNHGRVQGQVFEYLKDNVAADLRALVAISTSGSSMVTETERAHQATENAVTTRALGFAYSVCGDPLSGIQYLHSANRYAKEEDNKRLMVASSNELAVAYQLAGKYREANRWASWALHQFTELGMQDELQRLFIISEVAYPALLTGQVEGVASLLESITIPTQLRGIPSVEGILSTLVDYALLKGDADLALEYAEINQQHLPEQLRNFGVSWVVRSLIALGRYKEAYAAANASYCSVHASTGPEFYRANLAVGTALTETQPREAHQYLSVAHAGFQDSLSAPSLAQASIMLGRVHLQLDNIDEARRVLAQGNVGLAELAKSGWVLLGGGEHAVHDLWDLWTQESIPIELRFLGSRKLRIEHRTVNYPLRWCEILAVLAFHPEGLNGERLSSLLYGDGGNMSTLKANLSRMRKDVPVSSRPYRIELPYQADFVDLDTALREGRIRDALELYHGPLLPESDSPFVVELREYLEETLRQAALNLGDVDVLLSLARKLGDDLELWEATSMRLSHNDPLLPLAKAHVKRIQRSWG